MALALALGIPALAVPALAFWASRAGAGKTVAAPTASASASASCASNGQCGGDGARVCRAGACVTLASEDCRVVADPADVANDATAWLGVMFATGAGGSAYDYERAVELAREDFVLQSKGIPRSSGVGPSRPIGLVVCDDSAAPLRAARHLVETVRVPAIIGFGSSQEVIDLAPSLFLPNDVLTLVATNPSPFISALPQPADPPRLVWRTTVSSASEADAIAALVSKVLEPRARAHLGAHAGAGATAAVPTRVALARAENSVGLGLSSALFASLRFNGRSVLENESGFTEVILPAEGDDPERFRAAADALVAFRPHVLIVYAAGRDLTRALYSAVEAKWPHGEPRPQVLIDQYPHRADFFAFLAADAERQHRYFGLTPPLQTPANVKVKMRFNERASTPISPAESPRDSYDAFYVFAYAAFAAGDGPLSGSALSRGIARLMPPGPALDVGPANILETFRVLRAGGNVDLVGAETSLDFDPATGDASTDLVLLCPRKTADGGVTFGDSGMVFRARDRQLEGRETCP